MSNERVNIEVEVELELICNECDGDLKLALQKNKTIYIEPCSNCCKKEDEEK